MGHLGQNAGLPCMTTCMQASHLGLHFRIARSCPVLALASHWGSTHSTRANPIRSAFWAFKMDSARAGVDILHAGITGIFTVFLTAAARETI